MIAFGQIAARIVADLKEDDACERCGDTVDAVNVESWETTGQILCEDCAEVAFEEAANG